jgi:hypothetical protein
MGKESRFFLLKKRGAVAIQLSDSADSTKNFATKKKNENNIGFSCSNKIKCDLNSFVKQKLKR